MRPPELPLNSPRLYDLEGVKTCILGPHNLFLVVSDLVGVVLPQNIRGEAPRGQTRP